MSQRQEFQMLLEIGANKHSGHKVATNLPFVKKKNIYVKPNKGGMPVVKIPETIKSGCVHPTYIFYHRVRENFDHVSL